MFDLQGRTKPILKWAGGKSGVLTQLLPHLPGTFQRYFEPFFGGGALFFALRPGTPAIINDSNLELITLYEVVRDRPRALIKKLDALAADYSEELYYRLRGTKPEGKIEAA